MQVPQAPPLPNRIRFGSRIGIHIIGHFLVFDKGQEGAIEGFSQDELPNKSFSLKLNRLKEFHSGGADFLDAE